jgi:uncharacterized membrane protein
MNLKKIILLLAATTTGLSAGLFFGFQVSIIPAFTTLPDRQYIEAMQAINIAIQNPVFLFAFVGAAIFLPVAAYMYRGTPRSPQFTLLLAAALLYIIGAFGITSAINVPMNDTLAAFSLHASSAQAAAAARTAFENPWNTWHLIRTLASIGSFILAIVACFSPNTAPSKPIQAKIS